MCYFPRQGKYYAETQQSCRFYFCRNWHQGELFYSWIVAELSDGKGEKREFRFCNELEPDRAFLHFTVFLAD